MRTGAECISLAPHERRRGGRRRLHAGRARRSIGSHVLLAVGRRPNTDDLGLDRAGVATDARGYITVDDSLATNVPGIWALGDCNGRGAFTHTAYNDFEIVAANLLDGDAAQASAIACPAYALYIDPPLGRVGHDRDAGARDRPAAARSAQRPMTRVGRAVEKGETQGFMKVVVDAETRQILGAAILGTGGDEAIHGVLDIDERRRPLRRAAARRAHPSDRLGADSDAAGRDAACRELNRHHIRMRALTRCDGVR